MKWLDKLERKFGRFAIKNLMTYIVGLNAAVFILYLLSGPNIINNLMLKPELVLKGEVWRLVTFIFIPPSFDPIFIIFSLYLYYMIGMGLEREWGSFKFNIYYLVGMLGTTIGAFISGTGSTGYYLNLSLFLAFAYIYPDYEILLFMILPVKMKYLGWLDAVLLGLDFLKGNFSDKLTILAAVLNFLLFFGKDIFYYFTNRKKVYSNKVKFSSKQPAKKDYFHKCTVCGITEKDDKNMDFRYCSSCEGHYEYCIKHLKEHEHIKKVIEVDFRKNR